MKTESSSLTRIGAWGQIVVLAFGGIFWTFGFPAVFLATCVGYVVVTTTGIIGIAQTESAIEDVLALPFIVPGFVPLYYFATQ